MRTARPASGPRNTCGCRAKTSSPARSGPPGGSTECPHTSGIGPCGSAVPMPDRVFPGHYSHGIAYHEWCLHEEESRPVIYGTTDELGTELQPGASGYEQGKRIYTGGLAKQAYRPELCDLGGLLGIAGFGIKRLKA